MALLVVGVLDEFYDDVLGRLDLQHLEDEANEGGGLDVAAIVTTYVIQHHSTVHQQLG